MWVIADSGGTSTTWAIENGNEVIRFETASLHPRNIGAFPESDCQKLQVKIPDFSQVKLYFFGAGMSNSDNRTKISDWLIALGFTDFEIETDALAAGLSLVGEDHGWVAILGTGSILLEMREGKIVSRVGGLGPELGDEGSGYYFGKLLAEYLLAQTNWKEEWTGVFGTKEQFEAQLADSDQIQFYSELARKSATLGFSEVHLRNLEIFIQTHLAGIEEGKKTLNVSGSYGFYQRERLAQVLLGAGWELGRCFSSPMDGLIDFFRKKTTY